MFIKYNHRKEVRLKSLPNARPYYFSNAVVLRNVRKKWAKNF